jgi:hypothetical protein
MVLQLMRAVAPRRSSLPAESYALIADGKIYVSDVKSGFYLTLETGAPEGVVNIALALKSGRIDGAYVNNFDASECVLFSRLGDTVMDLDPALFDRANGILSLDFAGRCKIYPDNNDALTGVFIGRNAICATDGHRLLTRPIATPEGVEIVVPAKAADILGKLPPVEDAALHFDCETPDKRKIRFYGAGYIFDTELIDGNFPAFEMCIPNEFNCVAELNAAEVAELKAGIDVLIPFTRKSNNMIAFAGELATVSNCETNKYVGATVPAVSARRAAFNGKYLSELLGMFPGGVNVNTTVATQEQYEKDKAAYDKALPELEKLRTEMNATEADYDKLAAEETDMRNIDDPDTRERALAEIKDAVGAAWDKFAVAGNAYKDFARNCHEPTPPDEANKAGMISPAVFRAGDVTALLMPLRIMYDFDDPANNNGAKPEMLDVKPAKAASRKPESKKSAGKISPELEMLVAAWAGLVGEAAAKETITRALNYHNTAERVA